MGCCILDAELGINARSFAGNCEFIDVRLLRACARRKHVLVLASDFDCRPEDMPLPLVQATAT